MSDSFLYFGYGSNLLKQRLHLLNPSAEFATVGKLKDYRLRFETVSSSRWQGAGATITAAPGEHVWGVVWRLAAQDRPHLDIQEGVALGFYKPLYVNISTLGGEDLKCLTYEVAKVTSGGGLPSPHYLDVLVRGAKQNALPQDYVEFLKSVETNGYEGRVEIYDETLKSLAGST